jgi:hypothetical protein
MFCVLAEADRRLFSGDASSALELIGLVGRHAACSKDNEREIELILSRSGLPADMIEQGLARGTGRDLDVVINQLVQDLAGADGAA